MDSLANKKIKITTSTVKNYKPGIKSKKNSSTIFPQHKVNR
jgi:hypothetical protein